MVAGGLDKTIADYWPKGHENLKPIRETSDSVERVRNLWYEVRGQSGVASSTPFTPSRIMREGYEAPPVENPLDKLNVFQKMALAWQYMDPNLKRALSGIGIGALAGVALQAFRPVEDRTYLGGMLAGGAIGGLGAYTYPTWSQYLSELKNQFLSPSGAAQPGQLQQPNRPPMAGGFGVKIAR